MNRPLFTWLGLPSTRNHYLPGPKPSISRSTCEITTDEHQPTSTNQQPTHPTHPTQPTKPTRPNSTRPNQLNQLTNQQTPAPNTQPPPAGSDMSTSTGCPIETARPLRRLGLRGRQRRCPARLLRGVDDVPQMLRVPWLHGAEGWW